MINDHKRSGYPLIAVRTWEEQRLISTIEAELGAEATVLQAAAAGGIQTPSGTTVDGKASLPAAIAHAAAHNNTTMVLLDAQHLIGNPGFYRHLLLHRDQLAAMGSTIVLAAPDWKLPPELQHAMPVLDFSLPDRDALREALTSIQTAVTANGSDPIDITSAEETSLLDAAAGLTIAEAENAFALSLATGDGRFNPADVLREKMRLVRSAGKLEVSQAVPLDSVGGLDAYKHYLSEEVLRHVHNPTLKVRGLFTAGFPGTGKSLVAKATASVLGWPLLRLDIGSLKGSLVGQSEANMRQALKLAEAVSPCVVWIDEIEKGVGGSSSSGASDGGTTLGMVGQLLTWLQEHTSDILTVATCNDYSKLRDYPELTRAGGRFDERFYVDLPSTPERAQIAAIHLAKLEVPWDRTDNLPAQIAQITPNYSGAEIEQVVKSAARRMTGPHLTASDIEGAVTRTKPLSLTNAEQLEKVREWGKTATLANTPEPLPTDRALNLN